MINDQWLERIFPLNEERLRQEVSKQEQMVAQMKSATATLCNELIDLLQRSSSSEHQYHEVIYQLELYKAQLQTLHFMCNKLRELRARTKPSTL